jgi:hypothetical protein
MKIVAMMHPALARISTGKAAGRDQALGSRRHCDEAVLYAILGAEAILGVDILACSILE